MIDRSTREPPPGVAPGATPNAVMESIDSGDFLAGMMRAGVATAVRQWYTMAVRNSDVRVQQHAPVGFARPTGTSRGWLRD